MYKCTKKESIIVIGSVLFFVFGFLFFTGTLTSGYHLVDNNVIVHLKYLLDQNEVSLGQWLLNTILGDLSIRFRPLYWVFYAIIFAICGDNMLLWSIMVGLIICLTFLFFYFSVRKIGGNHIISTLFSLIILLGRQSIDWWMLGVQEHIGILIFSISFWFLTLFLVTKSKSHVYISMLFLIMATLIKESFILTVPAILFFIIYNECKEKYDFTEIYIAIRNNIVYIGIMLLIIMSELFFIIYFVGTNSIGYVGLENDTSVLKVMVQIMHLIANDYFIFTALAIVAFLVLLLISQHRYYKAICAFIFCGMFCLPQFILYAKSGMGGVLARYLLPSTVGVAYLAIMPFIQCSDIKNKLIIRIYSVIVSIFLIFQFSNAVDEAIKFTEAGRTATAMLQEVKERTKEDTEILSAFLTDETNMSTTIYLKANGRDNVYTYKDQICQTPWYENSIRYQDIEAFDVIMMRSDRDCDLVRDVHIDWSKYERKEYGIYAAYFK